MSNTISMRETAQGVGEKAPLKHEHIKKDITDLMNPRYFEKVCIYYGYPNAINESWNIDTSVSVYKNYDIVVFGDEYYEPTHEAYADMIKIITELKKAKPAIKIFGYVPCAVKEGTKNHTTEVIKTIITKWNACGVTGVFLDEFGYDYWNTRERQNEIVSHARTFGMPVFVNSWEDKYVFSNEAITIDWMPDFAPNPTKIASLINKDDYSLYENMFWDAHSGTQKTQESWVVYKAYDYYNKNQSEFGMTYHKKYGTKTVSLDGILKAKELTAEGIMMRTISLYLARILNIDGIAFGDQNWGSSGHFNVWQLPDVPLDREGLSGVSVKYATAGHPNEFSTTLNGKSIVVKWDCKTQSLTAGTRELYIDGVLTTNAWFTLEDKVAELKVEVAGKAPVSHGEHVPAIETASNSKFLRNDNTWQNVTPDNIGAYAKGEVDTLLNGKSDINHNHDTSYYLKAQVDNLLGGKADTSHGTHVPTPQSANNNVFLRNDNTWQVVSPTNIGAYTKGEVDNLLQGVVNNLDWKAAVATYADIATTYPNPKDGWTVNTKDTNITYRYTGTSWIAISSNSINKATTSIDGLMSKEDKSKLDGVAANANNYSHPATHPASVIAQDSSNRFVTDAEKSAWNAKAPASHGNHVPATEPPNSAKFLRNDNTWQTVTPANIGTYTKAELDTRFNAKADASHGAHVPAPQSANNTIFLRNDNTWATVSPANIGAYTKGEVDNLLNGKANSSHSHPYMGDGGSYGTVKMSNWFRSTGNTGWLNETHGGGWMMQDSSWIRNHGNKSLYIGGANIACTGDVTAFYSDERLKKDFKEIDSVLDKVMSVKAYNYVQNDLAEKIGYEKNDSVQLGFKAQEIEKIFPEVVKDAPINLVVDEDPTLAELRGDERFRTLDYGKLTVVLWKAVQEQQKQIDELKSMLLNK